MWLVTKCENYPSKTWSASKELRRASVLYQAVKQAAEATTDLVLTSMFHSFGEATRFQASEMSILQQEHKRRIKLGPTVEYIK
ncbi:hypothetical protein E8E11_000720 [Didymella keratinophila]|nr:hypothetical protein E8E11_000720 [Didymella keratinophila]